MPIESKLSIRKNIPPVDGYSIVREIRIQRLIPGQLKGVAPGVKVVLVVDDYANKADAEPVYKSRAISHGVPFDPSNPLHVAQWESYLAAPGPNPPKSPEEAEWQPTETREEEWWDGDTVDEPINRGREVELSKELALAVIGYNVDGQPDAADNLVKKLYQAAMAQPGAFVDPKLPE